MPPFRFRAAAALDMRARAEDTAQQALGDARAALERGEQSLAEARAAFDDTLARGAGAAHDPGLALWYRNWITSQRQDLARHLAIVADRRAAVDAAVARLHLAHRDVRVLERLRDRLHAAWALAERRKEQKDMDWLGSVRHALRTDPHKEIT